MISLYADPLRYSGRHTGFTGWDEASKRERLVSMPALSTPWVSDLAEVDLVKLDRVWERMNQSERFGCKFGLFPAWIEDYRLSHDEISELMKKSEPFLGVSVAPARPVW